MSVLMLVRHGEAEWTEAGYGGLSPRGRDQARALGAWWADRGLHLDRVFAGPRARHQETAEVVGRVLAERTGRFPEVEILPGLDEYDAEAVLRLGVPAVLGAPLPEGALVPSRDTDPETRRRLVSAYREVTLAWARESFPCPEPVRFVRFRERVARALHDLREAAGRGASVAAFTSAGPVAAAVGAALGAADEPVMALSWVIRNTSVTEVLTSPGRLGLQSVNLAPHLGADP